MRRVQYIFFSLGPDLLGHDALHRFLVNRSCAAWTGSNLDIDTNPIQHSSQLFDIACVVMNSGILMIADSLTQRLCRCPAFDSRPRYRTAN